MILKLTLYLKGIYISLYSNNIKYHINNKKLQSTGLVETLSQFCVHA